MMDGKDKLTTPGTLPVEQRTIPGFRIKNEAAARIDVQAIAEDSRGALHRLCQREGQRL